MKASATANKKKAGPKPRPASPEPQIVRLIAIDDIDPSPLNRSARNIDELVASVREHGVQQPIKIRPKGSRFEIVYGERRYRAAKQVGLKELPATVEDLTDEEAHELRIVENACREDPHPLEEAEAYEALLAMKDGRGRPLHTADTLAKLVGRSAQYVYARLKLTALVPSMREAFWKGELTTTTAFLVARAVPSALQDEALREVREEFQDAEEGEPFPANDLAHFLEQRYLTRLDRAPFGLDDPKLLPEAGACAKCPKRSGNQPGLFTDAPAADTCTDIVCFRKKVAAHGEKLAGEVRAKGGTVLTEQQSNALYQGGRQLPWNSKYVDLDATCFEDPERRTWRLLLGDVCPSPTLATDAAGTPHALVAKADGVAALAAAGVEFVRRKDAGDSADAGADDLGETGEERAEASRPPPDPAAARAAAELRRATIANILSAIVAAAEARPADDSTFATLVFDAMTHGGYHDAVADAVKRRGIEREKGATPEAVLSAHASGLQGAALRALVLELAIGRGAYFAWSSKYSDRLTAAAAAYGIDIAAVEKTTAEQVAQRRAGRGARKPKKPTSVN
ncbi:ParB/RepB/Spo0J family partition protein [Anaeromyxobacter terrae]|uniref:ParB/RepB/Spo0J family partition protein n=1 Tax=Anaeromyxobacter terrae TaxID=2925406 RepID=UPI001F5AFB18|nr:ParB/RepB/Spo0J family partition protein [Anaeromyxobacter sp. SG22]